MEKPMIKNMVGTLGHSRITLAVIAGLCVLIATDTYAQEPSPAAQPANQASATAETERVIVTGSNIPTAEEVGPNPVFSINRDLINKSGQGNTIEELLKTQSVMGANSIPSANNGVAQEGPTGTSSISLRGFDPSASLVLIDGRRVAPYAGVASANSGGAFVDLVSLPITAVESIEILKDGASTTYGADAVAGVVNLKLYKDYRGAQVSAEYGNTLDKDAAIYSGDVLFGIGDDKTSITGDMFFYHHNSMFNRDRGNSQVPPFFSSNAIPFNLQVSSDVAGAAGGENLNPGGLEFTSAPDGTNGLSPASAYLYDVAHRVRGAGGLRPGFNFNATSGSFPEQERWGGYTAFTHKICDDQLQIYGDFFYVDAKTHDEAAPSATGDFETPGNFTLFLPPNHPLPGGVAPPGTPSATEVGMPAGAFNPFNPFEQIISGGTRARVADFGNRFFDNENIAERFTVGAKGDKLFNGTWGYDAAFMYSQFMQIERIRDVNGQRFERILNGNDSLFNPASADFIGQTTPYNPFGDPLHVPIASNVPLIDFARMLSKDLFTMKLATLDLNIYTTDLFDLPAGGVGLAFGGVFTRQSYTIDPDDQHRLGQELGVGITPPVKAGRKEYAFYGETSIPIFSPKFNIPGFYSLEFTAGARYEAWLNNDTNAAVPKVGVRWQPFDESLTIRSTWGEGFLEPSMNQLYGPTVFGLAPARFIGFAPGSTTPQDTPNPETTIVETPNRNLSPEHDRSWTGGIVYTPKWMSNLVPNSTLTLTVDLWDIERTGVIVFLSPQQVIAEYNAGLVPGFVSPARAPATGAAVLFDPSGSFNGVQSPFANGGRENGRGVDLGLQYAIETGYGTFTWLTRVSYLDQFVFQFPGQRAYQVAGRANNDWFEGSFFGQTTGGDAWYKWKGLTNLDWTWHNWDLNATVHLLDGFWETLYAVQVDGFFKQHYVHPTWFTDAQLSYSFIFAPPVESQPVAGYSKDAKEVVRGKDGKAVETGQTANYARPCWKNLVDNTTITVGVNDIFGEDPPHELGQEAVGNAQGYPGSSYDNLGRFLYVKLVKKF
jgi:iron complex outermembrane receptor protein